MATARFTSTASRRAVASPSRKRSSISALPAAFVPSSSFFFQAEDGIRDHCVTGVQTCALPISLTVSLLADIARDAGLPDGVFNVVQGIGEEAGAALTSDPGVARIAFTGSVDTGRIVAQAAAANLTPVSLELGGKSPFVIFADADPDPAPAPAINQFDNAGQVCLAGTRLLIERSIYDDLIDRFTDAATAIRQGDPREQTTDLGPLITRAHLERVDGFVERAKAVGARLAFGGGVSPELGGLYHRPTLFVDAPAGSETLGTAGCGP